MPLVEVSSDVSLHYEILLCEGKTTSDEVKPWLMMIHPIFLDSCYLKELSGAPVVRKNFNQILFDLRHHGRSLSPARATVDLYTLAADLAIGLEKLDLPAVHALGCISWSSEILLRMSAVFPEKVVSMCLCSLPPKTDEPAVGRAFMECFECCTSAESPDEWDEAISSLQSCCFGHASSVDIDILDEWAAIMLRRFPPSRSLCHMSVCMPFLKRDALPDVIDQSITQPVLALQGGADTYSSRHSDKRFNSLQHHPLSSVQTIPGSPLLFCRTHPTELLFRYMDWIKPILEQHQKQTPRPKICWKTCLERLAIFSEDESISTRDASQSNSYFRKSSNAIEEDTQIMDYLREREKTSFSLMGGGAPEIWTGAPFENTVPWRFSSRFESARMVG